MSHQPTQCQMCGHLDRTTTLLVSECPACASQHFTHLCHPCTQVWHTWHLECWDCQLEWDVDTLQAWQTANTPQPSSGHAWPNPEHDWTPPDLAPASNSSTASRIVLVIGLAAAVALIVALIVSPEFRAAAAVVAALVVLLPILFFLIRWICRNFSIGVGFWF